MLCICVREGLERWGVLFRWNYLNSDIYDENPVFIRIVVRNTLTNYYKLLCQSYICTSKRLLGEICL